MEHPPSKQQAPEPDTSGARAPSDWFILILILPLLLALGLATGVIAPSEQLEDAPAEISHQRSGQVPGRLVVVIIDSLRPQALADDQLMPSLYAFSRRPASTYLHLETCKANFTLPCVQTMFEGRQSPFVAGLHNFTGHSGSQASLPGTLAASGYDLAMISDHTLDSLYAAHANTSIDVQTWKGTDHLERDLKAINRGQKILAEGSADVLLLHIVGTDKSAHKDHPGSKRYRNHFGAVDEALSKLLDSFDLERDSLLIVGDHGHGELGHHDTESVAIFAGRTYQAMFDELAPLEGIRQIDLLYFMSYPMLLPVPLSYEGTVYGADKPVDQPEPSLWAEFLKIQQENLTAAGVPEGLSVSEGMARMREAHQAERYEPLFKYAPLLLLFALFFAHILSLLRSNTAGSTNNLDFYLFFGAAGSITTVPSAEWRLWLCVPILIGAGWGIWRQAGSRRAALRDLLFVALLTLGAAATGLYASEWAHYFHTTGGFQASIVVFYAALFGAGALLAVQFFHSLRHYAFGTMAAALFILPSGLYYYQTAQNVLLGAFIAAAAVGLWWLASHRQQIQRLRKRLDAPVVLSMAVTALAAFFLVWQEAGGWEWHLYAVIWMRRLGPIGTFGILGLLIGYWMWAARSWTSRAVVLVLGLGLAIVCVGLGELPSEKLVGSLLPALFAVGLLDVERRMGLLDGELASESQLRRGLLIAALVIISLWIAASGFLLQNVDFSFALDWFSTYFDQERDVFLFTFLATLLKYGLPPAAVIVALRTVGRREDFRPVMWGASVFLGLKVFLLLVQIFAGSTAQTEKYHELMISELLFVYPLALIVPLLYLAIRLVESMGRRVHRDRGG